MNSINVIFSSEVVAARGRCHCRSPSAYLYWPRGIGRPGDLQAGLRLLSRLGSLRALAFQWCTSIYRLRFAGGVEQTIGAQSRKGRKKKMEGEGQNTGQKQKMRDEHETLDVNKVHSSCQWTSSKGGRTRRDAQIGWEQWLFGFLFQLLLWIYKKKKKKDTDAEEKYIENRMNNNLYKVQYCVISMNMNRFERINGFSRTFKLNRLNTPGQKGKYTIISSSLTLL